MLSRRNDSDCEMSREEVKVSERSARVVMRKRCGCGEDTNDER